MDDEFKVKDSYSYFKKKGLKKSEIEKLFEEKYDKCSLINQITSSQIGYYCMRRDIIANGVPVDSMLSITTKLIQEYNSKYPDDKFIDFNEDVDY